MQAYSNIHELEPPPVVELPLPPLYACDLSNQLLNSDMNVIYRIRVWLLGLILRGLSFDLCEFVEFVVEVVVAVGRW